jgi:exopolysaccharide production protein ExoY
MFFAGQPDTVRLPPTSAAASGRPVGGVLKRGVDIVAALTTLILLAPLLAIVSLLVLATLGRPILCRHTHIGFGGRTICCYRFRTRHASGAHEQLTSLGALLTLSGIDKLPQLVNVLMGDLSCVGPRPMIMDQQRCHGFESSPCLRARPGITGAWPQDVVVTSSDEAAALDSAYVHNWSMRGDILILFKAIPVLVRTENANQKSL